MFSNSQGTYPAGSIAQSVRSHQVNLLGGLARHMTPGGSWQGWARA